MSRGVTSLRGLCRLTLPRASSITKDVFGAVRVVAFRGLSPKCRSWSRSAIRLRFWGGSDKLSWVDDWFCHRLHGRGRVLQRSCAKRWARRLPYVCLTDVRHLSDACKAPCKTA